MEKNNTRLVGRPRSFNSEKELRDKIQEYFLIWQQDKRPYTLIGLCLFLDICRDTMNVYERGEYDDDENKYSDTIKKAKMQIEMSKWEGMLTGKYDKSAAIFDLKVNHQCIEYEKIKVIESDDIDKEDNIDVNEFNYNNLSADELRKMAEYRKIVCKSIN